MNNTIQAKPNLIYKESFLPEINQKTYQSCDLVAGKIIKITKNNIYFDVGLKTIVKTGKRKFFKTFYEINKLINSRYSTDSTYSFNSFLKEISVGKTYKFILYQLSTTQTRAFIQFDQTFEHITNKIFFYEFDNIEKKNKTLYGYVLNNVNGGFSVGINGLVAFVPNNHMLSNKTFTNKYNGNRKRSISLNSRYEFKILNINFDRKNVVLTKKDK